MIAALFPTQVVGVWNRYFVDGEEGSYRRRRFRVSKVVAAVTIDMGGWSYRYRRFRFINVAAVAIIIILLCSSASVISVILLNCTRSITIISGRSPDGLLSGCTHTEGFYFARPHSKYYLIVLHPVQRPVWYWQCRVYFVYCCEQSNETSTADKTLTKTIDIDSTGAREDIVV